MGLYSDLCHLVVQISVSNKQQNVSVSMKRFCIPIILICAVNLFRVFFLNVRQGHHHKDQIISTITKQKYKKLMFLKGLIRSFF